MGAEPAETAPPGPGRISQKNLRAARSDHNVIAELRAGCTQSCDLAREIIHDEMNAAPATGFGASAVRHGSPGRGHVDQVFVPAIVVHDEAISRAFGHSEQRV